MPKDEYQKILDTVSHAVFGVMRQQALANIYYCLRNGVKVYLFRDSMVYKELIKTGYVCFTIEDDLSTESLKSCLNEQDAKMNLDIYIKNNKKNSSDKFREFLYNEVSEKQRL